MQDSFGQPNETWNDEITARAYIEPLSGRELFAAQQVNAETTTRITIRYRTGLNQAMRIVFGDIVYNIHSMLDLEMRHAWLEIMAGSGLNNG
jgi:SPP1 family predicted phage head-tail adaptor